ncbi:MAG: phenylacetate--CoA ligase family protein [Candidatus Scalinduaceae bacterium]
MLRKLIYSLGIKLRNNLIWDSYKFLCKSQHWDIETLENYQFNKCKELLEWAYDKSNFYKLKFDKKGVSPKNFNELGDLSKFPMVTKKELIELAEDIQIKEGFQKLFFSETSGSTGQIMTFYRNKEWDARTRAAGFRGYSWYGVKPWERKGYFWGYNIDPKKARMIRFLDFLQNRFRIFSYNGNNIKEFVKKLEKASCLEGYSSMIYEVAKIINEMGLGKRISLKMVKGTSEKIFNRYQDEASKAFGKKIISEYGAAETGIIAFECSYGNMHITMENVIVEEVDNEIIVTNLLSKSFPIIRYRLGDYIEVDKTIKCKCGMAHYIIKDVLGRIGNVIYGINNKYPSLTLYYIFKNLAMEKQVVLNYQAVQQKKGVLHINVEQKMKEGEYKLMEEETYKYFGDDMSIIIKDKQVFRRGKEKLRDFISSIN